MTNCVEYNEYKRGERNEAVVSTLRPFMAKFADAIKYGIITLVLTVSAVYGLSQNISTLESQKDYFNADSMTTQQQIAYIDSVNDLRIEWNNATDEQRSDSAFADEFTAKIDGYELTVDGQTIKPLAGHQISASYIDAIGDAAVMRVVSEGNKVTETSYVCLVKDIEQGKAGEMLVAGDNVSYQLSMTYTKADGTEYNSANINFHDKSTTSMRVWLRVAVSVVPIIFIGISLIIQHKKFVIDEKFYDEMLAEIDKRKQQNGEQTADGTEPTIDPTVEN